MKFLKRIDELERKLKEANRKIDFLLKNSTGKPVISYKYGMCFCTMVVTYCFAGELKEVEYDGIVDYAEIVEDDCDHAFIAVSNVSMVSDEIKTNYLLLDKKSGKIINGDKFYKARDEDDED